MVAQASEVFSVITSKTKTGLPRIILGAALVVPRPNARLCEPDTSEFFRRILSVPGFGNHVLTDFEVLAIVRRYVNHDYTRRLQRFA